MRKCNKITAISLRSTNVTNQSVTTIVKNLKNSLEVLDLQELPVYPGFIDSHCHFLSLGLNLNKVDLVGTKSFEDLLDRVKRYATNKELNAITGRGWDQNDWKIKRLTNKIQHIIESRYNFHFISNSFGGRSTNSHVGCSFKFGKFKLSLLPLSFSSGKEADRCKLGKSDG